MIAAIVAPFVSAAIAYVLMFTVPAILRKRAKGEA